MLKHVVHTKDYKPEVTNPQNCRKLVSHFIQHSKQRFILCQTWLTVTLTVQCCNLVNFSGTMIKGYFIFKFTLEYLNFSMLWVSHLWLVTLHICTSVLKRVNKISNHDQATAFLLTLFSLNKEIQVCVFIMSVYVCLCA
jgi:hypothetical protein